jgi:hypothetical protein
MNSQALQKRIVDGKLFSHGSIGEWPHNELRPSPSHSAGIALSADIADAQNAEYSVPLIPALKKKSWGNGIRLRER